VAELLAAKGLGEKKTTWRLRDWGISRQRYWGTPIPIIHCDEHGAVPVPERDLPVVLPEDCIPDGSGNPLNRRADFLNVPCPVCGKPARRETDTMDTFVDSSWYFMRYCDPTNPDAMVAEGTRYWMPMDQYIGGIEHAILHLLYARFWTKVMRDLGLVGVSEPFTRLLTQGMVLNHIYSRRGDTGGIEYFWPHEVEDIRDATGKVTHARLKADGSRVDYEGVGTMSKSKNNGVDPQALIDRYGADTARLFVMFASPPEQTLEWNDAGVEGAHRFLKRVWGFAARHADTLKGATGRDLSQAPLRAEAAALRREVHRVLRQVSHDYERMQYNTVVSGCMKLLNALEGLEPDGSDGDAAVLCEGVSVLLRALYPACPHICHALWIELGYADAQGNLLDAPWPAVDEAALVQDRIELVLQIGGKMRGAITVPAAADRAAIEAAALAAPEFAKFSEGRPAKKVIVVPGRLVNVVV
jgi:leucyl-tRNA synthetase